MNTTEAHLDLTRLEKVKETPTKIIARCPACAEEGNDAKGDHLAIFPSGKFCCIAHEKDKEHNSRIFELVGVKSEIVSTTTKSNGTVPWDRPIMRTHDYRDKDGKTLFQVVVHGRAGGEKRGCSQRRPNAENSDGWSWNLQGVPNPRPLFRLPELLTTDPEQPVWIVEGEKDADIVALGGAVATCNPGGAGKWHKADQSPLRDRDVIISSDNDEPGRKHAEQVARSLIGVARSIRMVEWTTVWPSMPNKADIGDAIENGLTLADIEAAAMPWKMAEEIMEAPTTPPDAPQVAAESIVEEIVPWETAVDLGALGEEVEERIKRHLILPNESRVSLALWVAAAYVFDSFRIFPRVVIHSPEKRCGKTTCMEILQALVPRGILASNVSPAAVFRVIEDFRPTLLIDEADSFLKDNEQLRGIINSSHTKAGAYVIRCDGDQNKVRKFSTWAPIVLAGIQRVADTIMDRSIVIELQRKGDGEKVDRLPVGLDEVMLPLRRKMARWAEDNGNILRRANPDLPGGGNDRARDNWFPLFAVADAMGEKWSEKATAAFLAACGREEDETKGGMLLADLRSVFTNRQVDSVWSCDLIADLIAMEERPWASWRGEFTTRTLSNMLKGYGISSADIRKEDRVKKGYRLEKCRNAFSRYLPPTP
jgi:hypothetical protein